MQSFGAAAEAAGCTLVRISRCAKFLQNLLPRKFHLQVCHQSEKNIYAINCKTCRMIDNVEIVGGVSLCKMYG